MVWPNLLHVCTWQCWVLLRKIFNLIVFFFKCPRSRATCKCIWTCVTELFLSGPHKRFFVMYLLEVKNVVLVLLGCSASKGPQQELLLYLIEEIIHFKPRPQNRILVTLRHSFQMFPWAPLFFFIWKFPPPLRGICQWPIYSTGACLVLSCRQMSL